MRKQQKKTDHLSLFIMAAFLVLSTSHFMCRFDVSGYIEGLFKTAWAQQPAVSMQLQPVTIVTPAADALAADAKVLTIARNPFMAPVSAMNKPVRATSGNNSTAIYSGQPVLRGIINNGIKQLAIIEYNNTSNYYKDGQSFDDYTVTSIDSNSVELAHPRAPLHLTLGRNN